MSAENNEDKVSNLIDDITPQHERKQTLPGPEPKEQPPENVNPSYVELHCLLKLIFCDKKINYAKDCIINIDQTGGIAGEFFFTDIKLYYSYLQNEQNFGAVTQEELEENDIIVKTKFQCKQIEINKLNSTKVRLGTKLLESADQFKLTKRLSNEVSWIELFQKILIVQHIQEVCKNIAMLKNLEKPDVTVPSNEMLELKNELRILSDSSQFINFIAEILEMHYITKKLFQAVEEIQENGCLRIDKFDWKTVINELDNLINLIAKKQNESLYGTNFTVTDQNANVVSDLRYEVIRILAENHKMPSNVLVQTNQSLAPQYEMKHKVPGLMVCLNNIHFQNHMRRNGAEQNDVALTYLFEQFNFYTQVLRDLTGAEMFHCFRDLSKAKVLEEINCFILICMGHGTHNRSTLFVTTDELNVPVDNIIEIFNDANCPALKGKPKIFFFPICRGENRYYPEKLESMDGARAIWSYSSDDVKKGTDILVVYSTIVGFVSYRLIEGPVFYIQALCEVFRENAYNMHIEDMIKIVHEKIESSYEVNGTSRRQVPCYENICFKNCYLNIKR